MLTTPVVFIIYNRPDLAERVFERIRTAQPSHLMIVADGPRNDNVEDRHLCEATRECIQIDWDCSVRRDYSEINLGCQQRIVSGLAKAFESYERAIILEDDCLPDLSFFSFCESQLERYESDVNVMHISGANFVSPENFLCSYAFTQYPTPWGWATWRRSWERLDLRMQAFFADPERFRAQLNISSRAFEKLVRRLSKVQTGEVDSWAYPWLAAHIACNGYALTPQQNLVENIGFDSRSTHTTNPDSFFANRPTEVFDVEHCTHPSSIELDLQVNREAFELCFGGKHRKPKLWRRIFGMP